jgi:hypothetical protein
VHEWKPYRCRCVSSLRNLTLVSAGSYYDNKCDKQLLYAFDDHVWAMKFTTLEESSNFITLDTEKLFSKLKSHELSKKYRPNHYAFFTSKALITSAHVGGHDANLINSAASSSLEFALSYLTTTSDEQYKSISTRKL